MKTLFSEAERNLLREATYATDLDLRTEAEQTWERLVKYVRKREAHLTELQLGSGKNAMDGFMVKGPAGWLPRGVIVAFMKAKEGGTVGSYGKHAGIGHVIVLYDAIVFSDDPDGLADRLERLPRLKSVFMHEFTHYLDQQRRKGPGQIGGKSKKSREKGDWSGYYQSAAEFNAYYQEVANIIEDNILDRVHKATTPGHDLLKKHTKKEMDEVFANFHSFWHHLTVENGHTKHRLLTMRDKLAGSKWEKKWMKRMHVLYVGLKRRVQDALR